MINIKKGMSKLMSVLLILFGTIVGSQGHEALIDSGDYNYEVGLILGVVIFGAVSLADLAFEMLKSAWFALKMKRQTK